MSEAALTEASILFDGAFTEPRLDHAEAVTVAADGAVWCGGEHGQVYRIADGAIELIASTGGFTLGLAFVSEDTLAICDIARPSVWLLDVSTRTLVALDGPIPDHTLIAPNAAVPLPDGSVLVSDSGVAHTPQPGILRYRRDGSAAVWLDRPLDFANGMALSPDGRTLYVAESWAYRVLAIEIAPVSFMPGKVSVHADLGSVIPDGLCVDASGTVYVGCYEPSRVLRIPARGVVQVLADDPTAHTLCHPTGVAARGTELIVANLGRWHLSSIPLSAVSRST